MLKFGLIGHPIAHSGSPALFEAAYNGKFKYDLIEGSDFEKSWETFKREYHAINITAPFKEMAFGKADFISEQIRGLSASNLCVKTEDRGIVAFNSDFLGVRELLGRLDGVRKVVVAGYGGAGKAAALAVRSLGLELAVCNRTVKEEGVKPLSDIPSELESSDMLIYTLPMLIDEVSSINTKYCLEANYRDPVLRDKVSGEYISGKEWLFWQAVTGYRFMTGEEPDIQAMKNI